MTEEPTATRSSTGAPRVLTIEDDDSVRESLSSALQAEGYDVLAMPDGLELPAILRDFEPQAIVLDLRLPVGPHGLSISRTVRAYSDVPILMLTAAGEVEDRLAGFRTGADDYMVKPFAMAELLARVTALLRRSGALTPDPTLHFADVVVDDSAHRVSRSGVEITLTRTEYDLLVTLMRHAGRILSKTQLLSLVWDFDAYDDNLVEVHISALRRKLEEHGPRIVQTVRSLGYVMRE